MDAKSAQVVVPSEPLKYQTWFLKVSIHCEGCRRKVKKVLQSIDGVFTTTVDPQQQKVTVTGSVGVETLIRKLVKAGKHAEIWPENLAAGKGKNSGKDKKQQQKKKNNEQGEPERAENHSTTTNAEQNTNSGKKKGIEKNAEKRNGENKSTGNSKSGGGESQEPEPENKGGQSEGGSGKKKKKKGQSGGGGSACSGAPADSGSEQQCSGQMNLSPTRQQSYLYPESYCYTPVVYLPTHNRLCPMGTMGGPSYYVSPMPYMCAGFDHDPYHRLQSAPFEIFSDENANACSIM